MKKNLLLVFIFLTSSTSWGQTNSFPSTGNAEIKSGSLLIETNTWRSSLLTLKDTHYSPDQLYKFQIESDGLKIKQDDNVNYNFKSGGDFLVRNGRVGIKTLNPKTNLDIYTADGNSAHGIVLSQGSNSSNRLSGRLFFENTGELSNSFSLLKSGDKLSFRGNATAGSSTGSEYMVMTNSGRIGIGTSAPSSFLHVYTTGSNSATGVVISQGSNSNNRLSGRLFFENTGEVSNSFVIMKSGDKLSFRANATAGSASGTEYMNLSNSGQVGIGTASTGTHKLAVDGSIGAREIKVEASGWSDFVFEKGYTLRTLEDVEEHIKERGHLPEIPTEAEVIENGINLGEMDAKLLQKIEELTLYLIEQNKKIEALEQQVQELKNN